MSSIDKYVAGEARSCNPRVSVVNSNGVIKGYIGGQLVFSITDRVGYLDDSERRIIHQGISMYEAEERERQRRERERIENERRAALSQLKSAVVTTKSRIRESYDSAQKSWKKVADSMSVASTLDSLKAYNVSAYEEKAKSLDKKIKDSVSQLDSEYSSKLREVEAVERSIRDDFDKQTSTLKQQTLQNIRPNFTSVKFPVAEIDKFKAEVGKLADALAQVQGIEKEFAKIERDGLVGSIAASALTEIRQLPITSLQDIDDMLARMQQHLAEIRDIQFKQQSKNRSSQIALLNGMLQSCAQAREYVVSQPYKAADFRADIVRKANNVLEEYSKLDTAAYTTCSRNKITEVYELVQDIMVSPVADERTLEHLNKLLDEAAKYRRDDQLQADNYADYLKKRDEMIERGIALDDIQAFNPTKYEAQKKQLNQQLLELDVKEGVDESRVSFIMASKVMEDMGYHMLYQNMGGEGSDALACEGIFVMPGCEGVVCQVVASGCNISRKTIGVTRTNGASTSVQRVKEVAEIVERNGEINEFFSRYSDEGGGYVQVTKDVYVDDPNCEQAIEANGCFKLTAEGEKIFDRLVQTGTDEQKRKWGTRLGATQTQARVAAFDGEASKARQEEARRFHTQLQQARAKK